MTYGVSQINDSDIKTAIFNRQTYYIHGGTAIFSKNNVKCSRVQKFDDYSVVLDCGISAIDVDDYCILSVYRSPNVFQKVLSKVLRKLYERKTVICGDFNVKFGTHDASPTCDFFRTFSFALSTNGNCLDNIFDNYVETRLEF